MSPGRKDLVDRAKARLIGTRAATFEADSTVRSRAHAAYRRVCSHFGPFRKPFTYDMACTVNGASFHFDRILHMGSWDCKGLAVRSSVGTRGFVDGHSVLELDLDAGLVDA